jgi:hypothetical protein
MSSEEARAYGIIDTVFVPTRDRKGDPVAASP